MRRYRLILRTPQGEVYKVLYFSTAKGADRAARREDLRYGAHLTRDCIDTQTETRVPLY